MCFSYPLATVGDHVPNDVCSSLKGVSVELQRTRISVKQSTILPTLPQKIKDRGDYFARKLYTFSKTNMAFRFKVQDQRGKIYLAVSYSIVLSTCAY